MITPAFLQVGFYAPRARAHIGRGCAGPFFPTNVMLVHVGRINQPTKPL
jgi:hypothetical protein